MIKKIDLKVLDTTYLEKRRQLAELLRKKGIENQNILEAITTLPREYFVLPAFQNRAYEDNALPIECCQTISQPYTVAFMTQILNVNDGDKVLEIGTGSGYQACILYLLGATVYTVERISDLYLKSLEIFKRLGFKINTRLGDGSIGWKENAPYNGIIVTAAAPKVPQSLIEQLEIGGRLVIPVGDKISQTMHIITKVDDVNYKKEEIDRFKFVPLIGKEGW